LFPHHQPAAVAAPEYRDFLLARLLQEGDRDDLRWLFRAVDANAAAAFVASSGGRKLDRRSRAFWETLLATPASKPAAAAAALWPWA
jgi:hypothetical protein